METKLLPYYSISKGLYTENRFTDAIVLGNPIGFIRANYNIEYVPSFAIGSIPSPYIEPMNPKNPIHNFLIHNPSLASKMSLLNVGAESGIYKIMNIWRNFINNKNTEYCRIRKGHSTINYLKDLRLDSINCLEWRGLYSRNNKLIFSMYSMFDIRIEDNPIPLFVLVTKKENIKAIRAITSIGGELPANLFEVWVNPDFDKVKGIYTTVRTYWKKVYKPFFESLGIEIIRKDSFEEIFPKIQKPILKTPSQQRAWLVKASSDLLQHLRLNAK